VGVRVVHDEPSIFCLQLVMESLKTCRHRHRRQTHYSPLSPAPQKRGGEPLLTQSKNQQNGTIQNATTRRRDVLTSMQKASCLFGQSLLSQILCQVLFQISTNQTFCIHGGLGNTGSVMRHRGCDGISNDWIVRWSRPNGCQCGGCVAHVHSGMCKSVDFFICQYGKNSDSSKKKKKKSEGETFGD
jgi:hypothetical protein